MQRILSTEFDYLESSKKVVLPENGAMYCLTTLDYSFENLKARTDHDAPEIRIQMRGVLQQLQ